MVDCGSPRCAQWRRSFRRDLQLWGKKLPVVLGLERIAADYVDKETSELLLSPYPAWEKCMTSDFEPAKKCFHCDKKLPNIYRRIQRIIDEAKKGKAGNGKICLRSLQDLMPFCLDFYKHGFGHELFSDCVKEYFINASTVSTESLAQQTLLTSSSDADPSIPRSVASIARTGDNEEGPIDRLAPTTSASSSSVLAPRDNSLNRIRVPNVTSGRVHRKNEKQLDVEKRETLSNKKEDSLNVKRPWQCSSSVRRSSPCRTISNHSKSQDDHRYHPYHNHNHNKLPFVVNYDDHPLYHKRLRSHPHNEPVEVIISDSDEEEAEHYYHKRQNHLLQRDQKCYSQYKLQCDQQQKKREESMSAIELFESAHRRLRLEQLEQLGQLGQMEHEQQQQQLEGMCTAASASLFRLANQHLLPPGVDQSTFSAAAAAAVAIGPASPALPFLLPILPCSLKLKLEPGEEERVLRRERGGREDYHKKDELFENPHMLGRGDHLHRQNYQGDSRTVSSSAVLNNSPSSYETMQQQCRLENLRRMHNLNGVVKQGEHLEEKFKDRYESWPTRAASTFQEGNDQHDFYHKELKLPLLTNLVRKLVHQKFEEITRKSREASRCETPVEESPESQHTHLQQLLLQQRNEESYAPYNPYLTPMPRHLMAAAMTSNDENIATPMYKYIMESIYTNMMKDESNLAPKSFGKVNESGRVGDALKDIITKSISQKMQTSEANLPDERILCPNPAESLQGGYAAAHLTKSEIWSPALSAARSDVETKEASGNTTIKNEEEKDIVSPPPKRSKKESNGSRSKLEGDRRSVTTPSSTAASSTDGSATGSGKKTRPKRGQYRKYNSQLLMDAVKAVQRGEMSVHRAGSFYGVPHSTLEYKVKERHLLRQKKPREAGESSDSKTASEASPPPPPSSSASPRLSLKAPTKADRAARTQSQDSCSSVDGEGGVCENNAGPPSSSKRQYKKAATTADSSSPRSSVSSSTPPSPVVTPLPPPRVSTPTSNPPASSVTTTSPPSSPPAPASPPASSSPSPNPGVKTIENPIPGNSLKSSLAWFQPYLEASPSMQQLIASATCTPSSASSSLPLDSLAHTNSASELLRKLQHKVQAKEGGVAGIRPGAFSPSSDCSGGAVELPCGQDRRAFDLHRHPHHQRSAGSPGSLQDRLMLYKQSA